MFLYVYSQLFSLSCKMKISLKANYDKIFVPYHSPVVLQFTMTTYDTWIINQWIPLAFFKINKSLFVILAFRFTSLYVDFSHYALNYIYLQKKNENTWILNILSYLLITWTVAIRKYTLIYGIFLINLCRPVYKSINFHNSINISNRIKKTTVYKDTLVWLYHCF